MLSRPAKLYLGAAIILIPVYFLMPRGSVVQGIFHPLLSVAAVALILINKRRSEDRLPWLVIGTGLSVYTVANLIWYPLTVARGVKLPFPSAIDVLFLVATATIGTGLVLYVGRASGRANKGILLDAGVLTGGLAILAWIFVIQPAVSSAHSSVEVFFAIAYPTLDLFMLVPIIILLLSGTHDWAPRLLAIGIAWQLASDFSYSIGSLHGTYHFGSFIDAGWLLFFISFAAAAMLPPVVAHSSAEPGSLRGWRFGLLAAATLLGSINRLYSHVTAGLSPVVPLLTIGLIALVLIRLRGMVTTAELNTKRMASIAESVPDAILSLNSDGHITYLSPAGERIFGYASQDVDGRHISELVPGLGSLTDVGFDAFVKGRDSFELAGNCSSGQSFPIEVRLGNASSEGTVIITAVIRDLSARKAEERELNEAQALKSAILGSLSDGLLVTDSEQRIVLANAALEKLTGWREDELLGRRPQEIFPTYDKSGQRIPEKQRLVPQLMDSESAQRTSGYEISLGLKDDSRIPVAINASPIVISGKVAGAVVMVRDVTSEREVDQMKSSLVSTVSHELRTPLTMITGFAELMLSGTMTPERSTEAVQRIYSASQRLGRLIEDLLSVSRIESGKLNVRIGEVELPELISDTVSGFGDASERITIEGCSELPKAMGDPDLVVQVLTNLISNALKYSDPGSPIRVRTMITEGAIETSVTDRGIGLSREDRDHLFQKFNRVDRPEVHAAGGTGLGLYITKNLVEMQGGRMSVTSRLGEGSTFSFALPLARESQEVALG